MKQRYICSEYPEDGYINAENKYEAKKLFCCNACYVEGYDCAPRLIDIPAEDLVCKIYKKNKVIRELERKLNDLRNVYRWRDAEKEKPDHGELVTICIGKRELALGYFHTQKHRWFKWMNGDAFDEECSPSFWHKLSLPVRSSK